MDDGDKESGVATLQRVGVRYYDAVRLAQRTPLWRIKQAIKQWCLTRIKKRKKVSVGWLVQCLDEYWLPFLFFEHAPPTDKRSKARKWALSLNINPQGKDHIRRVESAVLPLSFWEWEFLARAAVRKTGYDETRRAFCENPTQTNWPLCEAVYNVWKEGALNTGEFREHLIRLKGLGQDLSRPQLTLGPGQTRLPFNLRNNPSLEQLRALLLDLDDDDGPHVAWVDWNGELHIDPIADDRREEWFPEPKLSKVRFRVQSYAPGMDYVGPCAAADDQWVRELFHNVTQRWNAEDHGC